MTAVSVVIFQLGNAAVVIVETINLFADNTLTLVVLRQIRNASLDKIVLMVIAANPSYQRQHLLAVNMANVVVPQNRNALILVKYVLTDFVTHLQPLFLAEIVVIVAAKIHPIVKCEEKCVPLMAIALPQLRFRHQRQYCHHLEVEVEEAGLVVAAEKA